MGYLSDYLERTANGMSPKEAEAAHIREMHEAFAEDNIDDHQQGICPVCGCANIDYDAAEVDDAGVYYPAECNVCHTRFNECYSLEFAGHYNIERRY